MCEDENNEKLQGMVDQRRVVAQKIPTDGPGPNNLSWRTWPKQSPGLLTPGIVNKIHSRCSVFQSLLILKASVESLTDFSELKEEQCICFSL